MRRRFPPNKAGDIPAVCGKLQNRNAQLLSLSGQGVKRSGTCKGYWAALFFALFILAASGAGAQCPATFNVTGGGGDCGSGAFVGLSGSDTGVSYQVFYTQSFTFTDVNAGAPVAGTGSALNFGKFRDANAFGTSYKVKAIKGACSQLMSGSASVSIAFASDPGAYTVTGNGGYCSGGPGAEVGLSGCDPNFMSSVGYQLYRNGVAVGSPVTGNPMGGAISFGPQATAGTYTVIGTNTYGCATNMNGSVTVTPVGPPPLAYSVTGGGSYCLGGSGVAIGLSNSQTGVNYQLYRGASAVGSPVAGSNGSAISFGNQTGAGTYTVVAIVGTSACTTAMTGSANVIIMAPAAFYLTGGGAYCAGGAGVPVGLIATDTGVNYQLYRNATSVGSPVAGTASAVSFSSQTVTGTYTVVATTTATGCTNTMAGYGEVALSDHNWYPDSDSDGFGDLSAQSACTHPPGYVTNNLDCNDHTPDTGIWNNVGSAAFSAGNTAYTSLAIDGNGTAYLAYRDGVNGGKAMVMKYDGSSWVPAGNADFSAGIVDYTSLAIDDNDTPYIAYRDGASGNRATVMKYDGSSWVVVGSAGFSAGGADYTSLAIDAAGTLYVAYADNANNSKATVMKYDGSNWVTVGSAGFSAFQAAYTSIAVDGNGSPYISYRDGLGFIGSGSARASVMKFDGSNWVTVGNPEFSSLPVGMTDIAISSDGTPYVAFTENSTSGVVMKYNGSSWATVGSAFSVGGLGFPSIALDAGGIPFVAYTRADGKATAIRYNGSNWITLGNTGFSSGSSQHTSLALDSNGIPIVAFVDDPTGFKSTVARISRQPKGDPTQPVLAATATSVAGGDSTTLSISTGTLNDASSWKWHSGSCGGTPVGSGNSVVVSPAAFTTYYARGEGNCLSAPGSCDSISICVEPSINLGANPSVCTGATNAALTYSATTQSPDKYSIVWDATALAAGFTNVTDATLPLSAITLTVPGAAAPATYNGTLTLKNAHGCASAGTPVSVTIKPIPTVNTVSNQTVCNGVNTTAINFTGAVSGATYSWANNTTSIGLGASGTGNIDAFAGTNTGNAPVIATITVTPSASGCIGSDKTFTVTVNPTPTVNTVSNQTVCNGISTTAVNFTGAVTGTAYSWANNASSINLAANGTGNIASFATNNTGAAPVIATITVTPSANTCTGSDKTFTITVNPTPTVNTISNQTLCNGFNTTAVNFTGAVTGTAYSWTNTTASIGLAASGAGNIASFAASNAGAIPVIATVTVTPSANSCTGSNQSFTITVNPTPTVNTVSNQTLCNGFNTTAINFTGAVAGTAYSWANTTASIGLASGGIGNIASFAANNTGATPVTATVTVTPSANSCTGSDKTFAITVNPIPTVNTVSNQILCNGFNTTAINFTGAVTGTAYSWTNNTTSIGLGATGSGNIASFAAGNTGTAPVTATITVTPSANSCTGSNKSFAITVNPTPAVNTVSNQTLCNGFNTTAINFTGTVTGTAYSWTNNTASIGLAASGAGNIASFTATNTGIAPIAATVTVTPSANSCTGTNQSFTITVNPTPTVNTASNQVLCNGFSTAAVNFTGAVTGTAYSWTNTTASIGLAASGAGNIASFAATNITNAPVTGTITVTPSANSCTGQNTSFDIIVNPTPTMNAVADQAICNGVNTTTISLTGPVTGSVFNWINDNTSVGFPSTGTGDITSFMGINVGVNPEIATVIATPSANGCKGPKDTFTITVNPIPALNSTQTPPAICDHTQFSYTPTSATAGTTFAWSRAAVAGISNAAASGNNNPAEALHNTTPDKVALTYVYSLSANGCQSTQNVHLIVNPSAKLSSPRSYVLCSNEGFNYSPASLTPGTAFAWTRPAINGILPLTLSDSGDISEALVNTTNAAISVKYIYTLTAYGCNTDDTVSLLMNQRPHMPVIAIAPPDQLCSNTLNQNFGAATPPPAGTKYTWTATNMGVWTQSTNGQNAIVNFPYPGAVEVMLTTTIINTGCDTTASYSVNVSTGTSPDNELIYHNGRFVCLKNTADSYRWGYDDKQTLDSTIIPNESNEDYLNTMPDFTNKYYWVITKNGDCIQKAYYNRPTNADEPVLQADALKLYPNPASEQLNIELESVRTTQVEFAVYDIAGKLLMNVYAPNRYASIDISPFAQGFYSVTCIKDGAIIATAKFVKQ